MILKCFSSKMFFSIELYEPANKSCLISVLHRQNMNFYSQHCVIQFSDDRCWRSTNLGQMSRNIKVEYISLIYVESYQIAIEDSLSLTNKIIMYLRLTCNQLTIFYAITSISREFFKTHLAYPITLYSIIWLTVTV